MGATGFSILGLVLRQGMILVAIGAAVGISGGLAAAQLLKRILFSVNPTEPAPLLFMVGVLAIVATAACVIPARRATKVDPLVALRNE